MRISDWSSDVCSSDLRLAEQLRHRGGDDEEGEQRQQREIGNVAGMEEPVGPGADEHAFDQFVGPAPRPDLGEVSIEPDARRAAAPAPLLGRDGGDVLHAALDAQTGARVSLVAAVPGLYDVGDRSSVVEGKMV